VNFKFVVILRVSFPLEYKFFPCAVWKYRGNGLSLLDVTATELMKITMK